MSGKSWEQLKDRQRPANQPDSGLSGFLPDLDDDASLPDMDSDYQAVSSLAPRGLVRLCCVMGGKEFKKEGGKPYRAFQYVHLDSDSDFGYEANGQVMTLRFSGLMPVTIIVRGRRLLRTWDAIQLHKIAWIRVADRDFPNGKAVDADGVPIPFITSIDIQPVKSHGR
jgi:hypothetical protein